MELHQYNKQIYYTSYEEERDRPSLGYLKGEKFSIAIDAGHSDDHLGEFYELLEENRLPLPSLTILTHWHWDHSFALHAISGLSIANPKTNQYLKDFIAHQSEEYEKHFLSLDPSIALEYRDNKKIIVRTADILFEKELRIDAGSLPVLIFEAVSPHTDDATLILVPEHRLLFFGDATSGEFPTWKGEISRIEEMETLLKSLDFDVAIGGHWPPFDKQGLLEQLQHAR